MMTKIKVLATAMNLVSIDIKGNLLTGLIGGSDDVSSNHPFFKSLSTATDIEEYNISIDTGDHITFKAKLAGQTKIESAISLLKTLSA